MPMSDKDQDLGGLGAFFDAARAHPPAPSPELLARVLGDAEAEQVWITRRAQPAAEAPRAGLLEQLYRLLGGWPAMAGLTTAIVADRHRAARGRVKWHRGGLSGRYHTRSGV